MTKIHIKDYLIINGEKTGICGSLNAPRKMIFPAHGPESIFFYSDETFNNKVKITNLFLSSSP